MKNIPNWQYREEDITDIDQLEKDSVGFVYELTLKSGLKYIGKKSLYSKRKKQFTKKELEQITDKRLKKYKIIIKESDWKTYCGSNAKLKELVRDGDEVIKREILQLCKTDAQLTYFETKWLFCSNALISNDFLNDNILGKFYIQNLT